MVRMGPSARTKPRNFARGSMSWTYEARGALEATAVPELLLPSTHFLDCHCVLQSQNRREQARRALRGANPHSHAELTLRYLVFCGLPKIRQLEHRLRSRCDAELRQHIGNVMLDRAFGSMQSTRDRGVR